MLQIDFCFIDLSNVIQIYAFYAKSEVFILAIEFWDDTAAAILQNDKVLLSNVVANQLIIINMVAWYLSLPLVRTNKILFPLSMQRFISKYTKNSYPQLLSPKVLAHGFIWWEVHLQNHGAGVENSIDSCKPHASMFGSFY
jgi:hypothetical protein